MFDKFRAGEQEQYLFLQLPIMLIKDDTFKELSSDAKILYSLLLNRTSLSAKNNWVDDEGYIYIIYTIEQIMEDLNCWEKRAIKAMKELKDIGLVESIRRGLGKPNILYVTNFATELKYQNLHDRNEEIYEKTPVESQNCQNDNSRTVKMTIQELSKKQFKNCQNDNVVRFTLSNTNFSNNESESSQRQTEEPNNQKSDETLTNDIDTDNMKKLELSEIKKELPETATPTKANGLRSTYTERHFSTNDYNTYLNIIQDNIDYDHYLSFRNTDIDLVNELIDCMLDVICTDGDTVKIGSEDKSRSMVISQYLKLNSNDIEHVIDRYKEQRHKITHINSYLKTMLYAVRQESEHYYINAVRADGVIH